MEVSCQATEPEVGWKGIRGNRGKGRVTVSYPKMYIFG